MSYEFVGLKENNTLAEFIDTSSSIINKRWYTLTRVEELIDSCEDCGIPMRELLEAYDSFYSVKAPPLPESVYTSEIDPGAHYRYEYRGIKLDPFRICQIYGVNDFALQTIIKKALKAGERGHKDMRQDLRDIVNAANRKLEMMDEDDG